MTRIMLLVAIALSATMAAARFVPAQADPKTKADAQKT